MAVHGRWLAVRQRCRCISLSVSGATTIVYVTPSSSSNRKK
jgi:hypothetical protein